MSEQKLKIALIQLTRIGDLVQTAQAVRQFRNESPDIEVTLIARRKFAKHVEFLLETVFDEIVYFDIKDFFSKPNLKTARTNTHNFIFDLNRKAFDVVVNLSFNKSSTYLASLLDCKLRLGMHRNQKSEISINDKWSQFVYSNVMNSTQTPFSLVDIFRYIMGCQDLHVLNDSSNHERQKKIVLHPFASAKKKKWGINKWNELIYKIAKDHEDYQIHIVGGPEDHEDAQRIIDSPALENYKSKITTHTQNSTMADTYQLLMDAQLFIGHDSVVSHLAAETFTPGIVISLGTVRPHETTAYQKNIINVAPKNKCFPCTVEESCESLPCHNSISYQAVATIASGMLDNEEINTKFLKDNITPFQIDTLKVYKSDYDTHGLTLKEITENYQSPKEVFREFYKIIWQCYLRDTDLNAALPEITQETASQLYKYMDGVNYIYEIYSFGIKFSNNIITETEATQPNIAVIQENINKLNELDALCNITKKSYPLLTGLIDYFYVHKANVSGDNIIDISKNNLITFYDASNLAAVLYEFLEKSLAPHLNQSTNKVNDIEV